MAVDAAMVERVAKLARLRLEPGQAQHLETEINGILGWIEQLQQVDTEGVAPMAAVIPNSLRLRDDIVTEGGIRDEVLANAPQAEHGFFAVPKVIE